MTVEDGGGGSDGGVVGPTAVVTPGSGGVVELNGASVTVPSGAVDEDTMIEIREVSLESLADLPGSFDAVTLAFALLPHGQTFSEAVTVVLPHDGSAEPNAIAVRRLDDEADQTWEEVSGVSATESTVEWSTQTFSVVLAGTVMNMPMSCRLLPDLCNGEGCCGTLPVPGVTYEMGDNGGPIGSDWPQHTVTVSGFSLEKYEVPVGRFRVFADQYTGAAPAVGAGAHPLIPNSGWQAGWEAFLPADRAALDAELDCNNSGNLGVGTWTPTPGDNESLPLNCVSWQVAFAFCAWDGGRLPTEAEWEAAATGGEEDREYPWGDALLPDGEAAAAYGGCYDGDCSEVTSEDVAPVGSFENGRGRWGHYDLAGNVAEWCLDYRDTQWYVTDGANCNDCANLVGPPPDRVIRGGYYGSSPERIATYRRAGTNRGFVNTGFRCAR